VTKSKEYEEKACSKYSDKIYKHAAQFYLFKIEKQ
jgi:hypothetical protein